MHASGRYAAWSDRVNYRFGPVSMAGKAKSSFHMLLSLRPEAKHRFGFAFSDEERGKIVVDAVPMKDESCDRVLDSCFLRILLFYQQR